MAVAGSISATISRRLRDARDEAVTTPPCPLSGVIFDSARKRNVELAAVEGAASGAAGAYRSTVHYSACVRGSGHNVANRKGRTALVLGGGG